MIVAGIGCRPGVSAAAVLAAVDAALERHERRRDQISCLATGAVKHGEAGIVLAAGQLGVPLHYVAEDALADVEKELLTSSNFSLAATGSPSLSEASALATAGRGSRLLGPRVVAGHVTCALAVVEPAP